MLRRVLSIAAAAAILLTPAIGASPLAQAPPRTTPAASLDEKLSAAENQIGDVGVAALKTAQPGLSMDFTFVDDGKDKWGLGFLRTTRQVPGKRSAGSLSWGGINNTYFWIDPARGVAGVILMQFLPFADTKALAIYDVFERGVYQLADAPLKSSR
jgi:CubicO group peptidase (beta-lactamase class C family)